MWVPKNITDWLDERIEFIENILSYNNELSNKNKVQVSDCTVALENLKYCKKLYSKLLKDPNNIDVKNRFNNIANKLILDTVYQLDKQEYKCIYVDDVCFVTTEKEVLPQEIIDNNSKLRVALCNIFNQVKELCGDKTINHIK